MPVPEQVKKQGEAADKLYNEIYPNTNNVEAGKVDLSVSKPDLSQPANPGPNAPQSMPLITSQDGEDTWKHKYSVLDGMYKADTGKFKDKIKTLEEQLSQITAAMVQMQKNQQSVTQQPAPVNHPAQPAVDQNSLDISSMLTQEEIDMLDDAGVDQKLLPMLVNLTAKVSGRVAQTATQPIIQRVQMTEEQAKQAQQEAIFKRQEAFFASLADPRFGHPDWEQVNDDPRWKQFLMQEIYAGSNITRDQVLKQAQDNLNQNTIISMMTDFKKTVGLLPANYQQQFPPAGPNQGSPADRVDMIVPQTVQGQGLPQQGTGKIYTPDEITKFYSDKAKLRNVLKINSKMKAEYDATESDIIRAKDEGRILNSGIQVQSGPASNAWPTVAAQPTQQPI